VTFLDGVDDKNVLQAQLLDCDDSVLALALSSDARQLAAAGCDRTVRVWDIAGGISAARLDQEFTNHTDWVWSVSFSRDGKLLLTASRDQSAKIWDLRLKDSVATFLGHQNSVYGAALNVDGKSAMSVGEDGALRYWYAADSETKGAKDAKPKEVKAGQQIKTGKNGHAKAVFRLLVHGDAENMLGATCSADNTLKLWNLTAGMSTRTLTGLSDFVYAAAFSPDGSLVAAGGWSGEIRVWKVADGQLVRAFLAAPTQANAP
jgi:WD40 repeat protein